MPIFPTPHKDELLYSVVARAGVYAGIRNAKVLAREILDKEGTTATLDLPSRVNHISRLLASTKRYTSESLIYNHTLFPLYAPFVQDDTRALAIQRMSGNAVGPVHLMLGIAASRVKTSQSLRYCEKCARLQILDFGESYWRRDWFLPSVPYCRIHGSLTILDDNKAHRKQEFVPLILPRMSLGLSTQDSEILTAIADMACDLLHYSPKPSPSISQWSQFYQDIASNNGLTNGKSIKHADVFEAVNETVGSNTLRKLKLFPGENRESYWLTTMFRKQRKSFSYLEHLLVWKTFLANERTQDILDRVSQIRALGEAVGVSTTIRTHDEAIVRTSVVKENREKWSALVDSLGVSDGRSSRTGGALYAWLYRNDNQWLLQFNLSHKRVTRGRTSRVDWRARDINTVRKLIGIKRTLKDNPGKARRSSNWYLTQIQDHRISIEKNAEKVPLTQLFLTKYAESVSQHQIRRLCKVFVNKLWDELPIVKWQILREAGLSDRTITAETKIFATKLKLEM